MAISFNETRDQISSDALQLLGYLAAGETASANDLTFCANAVNKMIKAWMAQGIHLFTEEEGIIYPVVGQAAYVLTATGGANGSNAADSAASTTLTTAATGTTIVVTSAANMSVSDNIGIQMDATATAASAIFWTTITVISGTTITLNAGLTSKASIGNAVFAYTNSLTRPLSIQSARYRDANTFDRWVKVVPRDDYMRIPQKNLTGQPIILYYSAQTTTGVVYMWPTPSLANGQMMVTYLREINDVDNASDNFDFPQEWLECLTYNLAVRIAPAYGISLASGGMGGNSNLLTQAAQYLEELKAWDTSQPYIQFVPGWDYRDY